MKVNNSTSKIYQNIPLHKANQNQKTAKESSHSNVQKSETKKINIPKNLTEQTLLTKKEQDFFQNLYPKAKKEIRQYMQHQNNVKVDKGKYIDLKG